MKKHIFIIGGMNFKSINAAMHRYYTMSKLFDSDKYSVVFVGVGHENTSGKFMGNNYFAKKHPRSFKEWVKHTLFSNFFINILKQDSAQKIVIISCSSIPVIPMLNIIRYCKKHKYKYILDIDEWFAKSSEKFPRNIVKDIDTFVKMKIVNKKAKNAIVSSTYLKKYYYNNIENIFILPAIVSIKYDIQPQQLFLQNGVNAVNLSFIGVLEKNNTKENLDSLITAINCYNMTSSKNKIHLNVIGTDGSNSKFVHFYGKQPYRKCIEYLVSSDFTVIPRNNTRKNNAGFPTKMSESYLYEIPVISTDTSDISKYIISGINGYLVENNTVDCYLEIFKNIDCEIQKKSNYLNQIKNNVRENNLLTIDHFKERFNDYWEMLK